MSEPDLSTTEQIAAMTPAELTLLVHRLIARTEELSVAVAARDERIAELEASLERRQRENKRQAAPFSKGKSDDPPAKAGRKPGKGYGAKGRRKAPERDPDRTVPVALPGRCADCGGPIDHTHQASQLVEDLPPLAVMLTEFIIEVGRCRDCGRRVQPRHPDQASDALGAAGVQVGPHAKAFACWLHYELGLSFAKCSQVLARFGIDITASALVQACAKIGADLAATVEAIRGEVNSAIAVTADETGWRVDAESWWLWVATTDAATIYAICEGRGANDAQAVLDLDFDGTIVADGWVIYRTAYGRAIRQTCLAHLLRRANDLEADNPPWARSTPRHIKTILCRALDARGTPPAEAALLIEDLTELIELLSEQPHPHEPNRRFVAHLARELADDAVFTFLEQGCDATNWRAEQAIRPAVVNRKVYGGNKSAAGAITQSRIMSVLRTARQQGADAIALLADHARAPNPTGLILPLNYPNTTRLAAL
jgi:transposase